MARHFKRSKTAVTIWRTAGVPRRFVKAIRDFTNGEVTLEELAVKPESRVEQEA